MAAIRSVLVTGGLGYLGGRISKGLAESGLHVRVGTRKVSNVRPPWLRSGEVVRLNMEEPDTIEAACQGIDAIVHLAATNEIVSLEDPELAMRVNAIGTLSLVRAAGRLGVKRLIYFSTAAVYGSPLEGTIDEDAPLRPIHPYAYSHRSAEDIVLATRGKSIPTVAVVRLSNGFGAPERLEVDRWTLIVNDLCRQAALNSRLVLKSSGEQLRDFIPLSDVVNGVSHILQIQPEVLKDPIYNLGGEMTLSILEMTNRIADRAEKVLGTRPKIERPNSSDGTKVAPFNFSIEKIKGTGFRLAGSWENEIDDTLRMFGS